VAKEVVVSVSLGLRDQRYRSLPHLISFLAKIGGPRDVVDIQGESYGIRRAITASMIKLIQDSRVIRGCSCHPSIEVEQSLTSGRTMSRGFCHVLQELIDVIFGDQSFEPTA
jgi:hypothetical protein